MDHRNASEEAKEALVDDTARERLVRRAIQGSPYELCGFILQDNEIVEVRNVSNTPLKSFEMSAADLSEKLRGKVDDITGIWHSHPRGQTHPSYTDLRAIACGAIQPHWTYYIVTFTGVYEYDTAQYAPVETKFWGQFARNI